MEILIGLLGGGGIFAFIQFLIDRKDRKSQKINEIVKDLEDIKEELLESRRYSCRSELLILMNHYSGQTEKIFKLAEHYFKDLKGDFYMTSLFKDFCIEHNLEIPKWYRED